MPDQPVAYFDLVSQIDMEIPAPGVYKWEVIVDNVPAGTYAFEQ